MYVDLYRAAHETQLNVIIGILRGLQLVVKDVRSYILGQGIKEVPVDAQNQ